MFRFFRYLRTLAILCLCVALLPTPTACAAASDTLTVSFQTASYQNRARELFKGINAYRNQNGAGELQLSADLDKAAMQRAAELFVFFDHQRPDLTDYDTVLKDYKTVDRSYITVSECIGAGFAKADEALDNWRNDLSDTLLDGEFTHAGIACMQVKDSANEYYWCLLLVGMPENTPLREAGDAAKAGTAKTMSVEIARGMYERADNSHRRFELRVANMNLKTKTSAQPTVYLYDRYDVKIGKCDLEDLTFKSSNTSIFTVNQDGTVKKKKNGSATLTVKAPGLDAATCEVTIGAAASDGSVTADTIGDAVPDLSAKAYSNHVSLSVYVKGASGYVLYRATAKNGKYTKVEEKATTSRWTHKLEEDDLQRTYYYKVRAYKNSGGRRIYSEYSEPIRVQP